MTSVQDVRTMLDLAREELVDAIGGSAGDTSRIVIGDEERAGTVIMHACRLGSAHGIDDVGIADPIRIKPSCSSSSLGCCRLSIVPSRTRGRRTNEHPV